jgi:hypothetical protein
LTTYTMTKRRTNNSLFNLELVEMGTNDLLKEQSVMNLLVSPNFAQSNDVSINLITSVNFFLKICFKVTSFSKLRHFSLYGGSTKNWCSF